MEALALLRKSELVELIEECRGADGDGSGEAGVIEIPQKSMLRALRKDRLMAAAESLLHAISAEMRRRFCIYRPLAERQILIYRLLFFGNLHQDLSEFVVTELGHVRYESYAIRRADRLFDSRETVERTLLMIELNEAYYRATESLRVDQIDVGELLSLLEYLPERDALAWNPDIRRMRDNLISGIARHLERGGKDLEALHLYGMAELPPARERRVRVLARLERLQEALELCREIRDDPWEDAEREFAERFSRKLCRKLGLAAPESDRFTILPEILELDFDPGIPTEEAVRRHHETLGFSAYHAENVLWTGLFGLAAGNAAALRSQAGDRL